jgi:hypothetical protein
MALIGSSRQMAHSSLEAIALSGPFPDGQWPAPEERIHL